MPNPPPDAARHAELLRSLQEVLASLDWVAKPDACFARLLELAVEAAGAEGGSLMLLEPMRRELEMRCAVGIEPELWPKIRVPLGEGIAGRAAADARSIHVRGPADRQAYRLQRERLDVEAGLCVPLVDEGQVLGVLNLHHAHDSEAFNHDALGFIEQLAKSVARIVSRAETQDGARSRAHRYRALQAARDSFAQRAPLEDQLRALCQAVAAQVGDGIATVYLHEADSSELRLAATTLEGGGLGGEYRVELGRGIDGAAARERSAKFLHEGAQRFAYAALPLVAEDELLGLLVVQAGERDSKLGAAPEKTLIEIAAAAAQELQHVRREAEAERRATRSAALGELALQLLQTQELSDVLQQATGATCMLFEAEHAVLRLRDDASGRYTIRSVHGSSQDQAREKLFRLDQRIGMDAIKRRTPSLLRSADEISARQGVEASVRSLLAAPLLRGGRVIGTLALYDKLPSERFASDRFGKDDLALFTRFAAYLERAVTHAVTQAQLRRHPGLDAETELPNRLYFERRLDEEIARSSGRGDGFALVHCRIENHQEIEAAGEPGHASRVVRGCATALRTHLRGFDLLARAGEFEFAMLIPEPEAEAGERVSLLARRVAEEVAKDDAINTPIRVALAFGYAVHPEAGRDRASLWRQAEMPRIRMV